MRLRQSLGKDQYGFNRRGEWRRLFHYQPRYSDRRLVIFSVCLFSIAVPGIKVRIGYSRHLTYTVDGEKLLYK